MAHKDSSASQQQLMMRGQPAAAQGQPAIINEKLQYLLENLCNDPYLDQLAAVTALLATAVDLLARLDVYLNNIYGFARMCKRWFPMTHQHYITLFLAEADDNLDVGFSLPLQKIALARGDEHQQREFMLSDEVQSLLEDAANSLFSHSLSAERMAASVKKREGRHISLLGNVSRDLLCRKFNIWRENKCQLLEHAAQRLQKAKRANWNAIAWHLDFNNAPLGHR